MSRDVWVAGVGMIPFTKPGASAPYPQMAATATSQALSDAGIDYGLVEQAYVGYVYGDSTAGPRALYEVGMTGIPILVDYSASKGAIHAFTRSLALSLGGRGIRLMRALMDEVDLHYDGHGITAILTKKLPAKSV